MRIAQSLGLSVTTVSRSLGGHSDVAAATRARIADEARRIGYRPNQSARRLRSGRTDAIGLVIPAEPGHFDDPFFLRMIAGLGAHLAATGRDLLVTAAPPGEAELQSYRHLVEGRRVDGVIVCRTRREDARITYLLEQGIPFVTHGRTQTRRTYAHLDIDGAAACRTATERLIVFGHRRIAMINAPDTYMFAHHREAGWRAALAAAGIDATRLVRGEPTEENGFRLAANLLRDPNAPTAILCATDRLAVGALHAIGAAGLRAGRDVSVIGYDNLSMATYTDPPLTTIEQPIERAAGRLTEMLGALLDGADPAGFAELWPATLVARASDGPVAHQPAHQPAGTRGPTHPTLGETDVPQSLSRP